MKTMDEKRQAENRIMRYAKQPTYWRKAKAECRKLRKQGLGMSDQHAAALRIVTSMTSFAPPVARDIALQAMLASWT